MWTTYRKKHLQSSACPDPPPLPRTLLRSGSGWGLRFWDTFPDPQFGDDSERRSRGPVAVRASWTSAEQFIWCRGFGCADVPEDTELPPESLGGGGRGGSRLSSASEPGELGPPAAACLGKRRKRGRSRGTGVCRAPSQDGRRAGRDGTRQGRGTRHTRIF